MKLKQFSLDRFGNSKISFWWLIQSGHIKSINTLSEWIPHHEPSLIFQTPPRWIYRWSFWIWSLWIIKVFILKVDTNWSKPYLVSINTMSERTPHHEPSSIFQTPPRCIDRWSSHISLKLLPLLMPLTAGLLLWLQWREIVYGLFAFAQWKVSIRFNYLHKIHFSQEKP